MAIKEFKELEKADDLVVLWFDAEWSRPSRMIESVLRELSEKYKQISFVRINVDDKDQMAVQMEFGIVAIPTVVFGSGKGLVAILPGARPTQLYEDMIEEMIHASGCRG